MVVRRNLYRARLALMLKAMTPVFAYAHIHVGAAGIALAHTGLGPSIHGEVSALPAQAPRAVPCRTRNGVTVVLRKTQFALFPR